MLYSSITIHDSDAVTVTCISASRLLWWSYNATFIFYEYSVHAAFILYSCMLVLEKEWNSLFVPWKGWNSGYIHETRDNILRVHGLEMALDTTKVHVLANLGSQTVLSPFATYTLNYNHFQTGRITRGWSQSVWGTTDVWESHLHGAHTYRTFTQNGHSKSWFSNFKVVLNSTATNDVLLIEFTQCTGLSTFIKSTAFRSIAISVTYLPSVIKFWGPPLDKPSFSAQGCQSHLCCWIKK